MADDSYAESPSLRSHSVYQLDNQTSTWRFRCLFMQKERSGTKIRCFSSKRERSSNHATQTLNEDILHIMNGYTAAKVKCIRVAWCEGRNYTYRQTERQIQCNMWQQTLRRTHKWLYKHNKLTSSTFHMDTLDLFTEVCLTKFRNNALKHMKYVFLEFRITAKTGYNKLCTFLPLLQIIRYNAWQLRPLMRCEKKYFAAEIRS